ncbi:MAG: hypothetical protein MRY74_16950 [Neomegalonema sp.]|nr:hypothetical protein [Neomegalonema sp.]
MQEQLTTYLQPLLDAVGGAQIAAAGLLVLSAVLLIAWMAQLARSAGLRRWRTRILEGLPDTVADVVETARPSETTQKLRAALRAFNEQKMSLAFREGVDAGGAQSTAVGAPGVGAFGAQGLDLISDPERSATPLLAADLFALRGAIARMPASSDFTLFEEIFGLHALTEHLINAFAMGGASIQGGQTLDMAATLLERGDLDPVFRADLVLRAYTPSEAGWTSLAAAMRSLTATLEMALAARGMGVITPTLLSPVRGRVYTLQDNPNGLHRLGFARAAIAALDQNGDARETLVVDCISIGRIGANGDVSRPRVALYNRLEWRGN